VSDGMLLTDPLRPVEGQCTPRLANLSSHPKPNGCYSHPIGVLEYQPSGC
jgi:hypothetical protein